MCDALMHGVEGDGKSAVVARYSRHVHRRWETEDDGMELATRGA